MKYFKFTKLVRDKILSHMKNANHRVYGVKRLNDSEYFKALKTKLVEEAKELKLSKDLENMKEELADVQELINYLKSELNLSDVDLQEYQQRKVSKNGAFDNRTYIGSVGVEKDNKWCDYYLASPDKYEELDSMEE